jgi:protein-S-isoprenylcysteine O-methyltransferase Ste14
LLIKSALKSLYFLGILAEIAIRVPHERRRGRTRMAVDRVDGSERALVGLLSVGMFFVPAVYALTPWLDWADYRLSLEVKGRVGGLGAAILAFAVWLFWRSHADLGRNWSPSLQVREEHQLVTEGVYRSIRHPMYASQGLWSVAQPLLLQNWIAGWAGPLLFLPLYLLRVPREEQMILEQFGEAYRVYMSRTGRIFPRLEGWGN